MRVTTLARSELLSVAAYACTAGPTDAPFVEVHQGFSLSYVRHGHFGYRVRGHEFNLVPGSCLLGHPGDEYICSHDHTAGGDECLAFHFADEGVDALGLRGEAFRVGGLPPLPELLAYGELASAAHRGMSSLGLDEVGMMFAVRFGAVIAGKARSSRAPSSADRRRAARAAAHIDAHAEGGVTLTGVAREVGLSAFHFLRIFTAVFGITPHQYLVRARLKRALALLSSGDAPITRIALASGFADLSNFVRTFHRAVGLSPRGFRKVVRGDRAARSALESRLVT